jgi:hypothetical protein
MGTTLSVFWWGSMRLVGGVASAVLFIAISAEIAETVQLVAGRMAGLTSPEL